MRQLLTGQRLDNFLIWLILVVVAIGFAYVVWRQWSIRGLALAGGSVLLIGATLVRWWPRLNRQFSATNWTQYKDFPWQALATLIGAIIAIITLYVTTRQKDHEAERKAYREDYADILDRFADKDNAQLRANAALRLADIGMRPFPGRAGGSYATRLPLYLNAVAQLSSALTIETDAEVRASAVSSLEQLSLFAARQSHSLWRLTVQELYRANRAAYANFAHALAGLLALWGNVPNWERFRSLAGLAPFCGNNIDGTFATLRDIAGSKEAMQALQAKRLLLEAKRATTMTAPGNPVEDEELRLLEVVQEAAGQLIDTRTALASTLRRPPPHPMPFGEYSRRATTISSLKLKLPDRAHQPRGILDLERAFLAGANLENAPLRYAWLPLACLNGANLRGAVLIKAHLRTARLRYANLTGALLTDANLWSAQMQYVDLQGAQLESAYLLQTDLQHANLSGVRARGAKIRETLLYKATLTRGWMPGVDPNATDFSETEWWEANFAPNPGWDISFIPDPNSAERDVALYEEFEERWPRPEEKASSTKKRWSRLKEKVLNMKPLRPPVVSQITTEPTASVASPIQAPVATEITDSSSETPTPEESVTQKLTDEKQQENA